MIPGTRGPARGAPAPKRAQERVLGLVMQASTSDRIRALHERAVAIGVVTPPAAPVSVVEPPTAETISQAVEAWLGLPIR